MEPEDQPGASELWGWEDGDERLGKERPGVGVKKSALPQC